MEIDNRGSGEWNGNIFCLVCEWVLMWLLFCVMMRLFLIMICEIWGLFKENSFERVMMLDEVSKE